MRQRMTKYPPKTLVKLQPVQVFAATFVDGQQYGDTRLVALIGDNIHFLHPEGVDSKIKQPAGWLLKQIRDSVERQTPGESVEVPSDDLSVLPTGSDA